MKLSAALVFVAIPLIYLLLLGNLLGQNYGAPPYGEDELSAPKIEEFPGIFKWRRPISPFKVGIQAGHWKNEELPDELEKLRKNGGATNRSGITEWGVNLRISQEAAKVLRERKIEVDILPATIPEGYWADAFVSIHADGNINYRVSGYKAASGWRDFTGKAERLVYLIEEEYAQATGMVKDTNVTKNMKGYYAFSWWRFKHTVHPMTPAVILETGFLTNPQDSKLLINSPEIPGRAIAQALTKFLGLQEQ